MAIWKIEPTYKKSVIERTYMHKDGKEITEEIGWRWGEFTCETEDDEPPLIEEGTDLFNCDYDVEMQETTDGCWEERDFEGFTQEEQEEMEEWLDENSSWELEENGWLMGDCEMIIDCDLEIRKLLDDGTYSDPVEVGEVEESEPTEAPKLEAKAAWPFGDSNKEEE